MVKLNRAASLILLGLIGTPVRGFTPFQATFARRAMAMKAGE